MAGDKQFFYYVNQIKKQTGIKLNIWMGNRLEETDFKTGFCNIKPDHSKDRIDRLSSYQKIKLLKYYGINFFIISQCASFMPFSFINFTETASCE